MSTTQVINILGMPDDTIYNTIVTLEFTFYFFTKNKSGLRSALPSVDFDKEVRVTLASYGDDF